MTQSNKAVLLCLSCALLVWFSGCGGSSTAGVTEPNGFLYSGNSSRPGSVFAFTVTTGALTCIAGTTCSALSTAPNAPYTLAAWPPPLPAPAAAVTTKFVYGSVPSSALGGVINRVLKRPLGSSVTGGIILMPVKTDHTLDTPQMFASGGDYDPIAVSPTGSFLYAIDLTANLLVPFSIDSSKGTLTAIAQGSKPVGSDPFNVVVDPQGKFVFVANCDCVTNPQNQGSVSVFSINGDGTLSAVPGSPFPLGVAGVRARPIAMAVSPDSKFLFVASLAESAGTADEVYVESIGANGALSDAVSGVPSADLPVGSTPVSIAVSTDGNYVYTGNAGNHTVSFFINNCTQSPCTAGAPLAVPTNNSTTPVSGTVGVILTDPTNPPACTSTTEINCSSPNVSGFLYVTDYDHGTIQAFSIISPAFCTGTANCIPGTLSQAGSPVNTAGVNPFGLAIAH